MVDSTMVRALSEAASCCATIGGRTASTGCAYCSSASFIWARCTVLYHLSALRSIRSRMPAPIRTAAEESCAEKLWGFATIRRGRVTTGWAGRLERNCAAAGAAETAATTPVNTNRGKRIRHNLPAKAAPAGRRLPRPGRERRDGRRGIRTPDILRVRQALETADLFAGGDAAGPCITWGDAPIRAPLHVLRGSPPLRAR